MNIQMLKRFLQLKTHFTERSIKTKMHLLGLQVPQPIYPMIEVHLSVFLWSKTQIPYLYHQGFMGEEKACINVICVIVGFIQMVN